MKIRNFAVRMGVAVAVILGGTSASAQVTIPFPGGYICNSGFVGLDKVKKLINPVPGKDGEKGVLEAEYFDSKNNRVQVWCLLANKDHAGPDLAYLFTSSGTKDADAVWIGACTFFFGKNIFSLAFGQLVRVPKPVSVTVLYIKEVTWKDEKKTMLKDVDFDLKTTKVEVLPDQFTAFYWHNFESPASQAAVKKDWEYTFDVANNKLQITKSKGKYTQPDGRTETWETTDRDRQDPAGPPKNFKELKFKDASITVADSGDYGSGTSPFRLALVPRAAANFFEYALLTDSDPSAGTAADPAVGEPVEIEVGDQLTIEAHAAYNPAVIGLAALPSYGGWIVDSHDEFSVTFRATSHAVLNPGLGITGFSFFADINEGFSTADYIPWYMLSTNLLSGSTGLVAGPVRGGA